MGNAEQTRYNSSTTKNNTILGELINTNHNTNQGHRYILV